MEALCWRQNIVGNKESADACGNFAAHLDPRFSVLSSKLLFSSFPCFLRTLYFFDDISHSLAPHFSALSSFSFIFSFSLTVCLFWGSPLLSSPHSFFSALSITRDISQFRHYFAPSLLGFFQSFFSASLILRVISSTLLLCTLQFSLSLGPKGWGWLTQKFCRYY